MTVPSLIKVVQVPHGSAPEHIKRGWVGCVFPCFAECGHCPTYVKPIDKVAATDHPVKADGFSVPQDIALMVLACHDQAAADWFYERGFPFQGGGFRFALDEVESVRHFTFAEQVKLGPMTVYDDLETGTMRAMR